MFKKIEIWILYLIILLGIPTLISFGFLVRQELKGNTKFGWVSKTALFLSEIPVNLQKLSISDQSPDHKVADRFPELDGFNGTPNSNESYLLLSKYDGDLREGIVQLVDLTNFKVLHTWNPDMYEFNQLVEPVGTFKFLKRDRNNSRSLLKHPLLLEDGSLVFHHSTPFRKIDACSNLIFQNTLERTHHSIEKDIDGNIWVPSYIFPQSLPEEIVGRGHSSEGGSNEDGILKLSPSGKILYRKSLAQIFIDNNLKNYLFGYGVLYMKDPLHLNDIQPVDFDGDYWKKGDLFLSLRNQSMIVLYRPSSNQIVWKIQGPFFNQHDIDILDDHRISIFNNKMLKLSNGKVKVDGNNEVNIYNFKTGNFSSYLKNSLIQHDVRTRNQGLSEILPNGDLFIEETNFGRNLYFNSDGTLRWTYLNRSKKGYVYTVKWSRIIHKSDEILNVKNFLNTKDECKN